LHPAIALKLRPRDVAILANPGREVEGMAARFTVERHGAISRLSVPPIYCALVE
jgi:hypothetical protein